MSACPRPLWQEPTLYLICFLPSLCLAVLAWLLWQAGSSAGTQELDQVRKIAQIQIYESNADLRATQAHLHAELRITQQPHDTELTVVLDAPPHEPPQTALALAFVHPHNARFDRWVRLDPGQAGIYSRKLSGLDKTLKQAASWRLRLVALNACPKHGFPAAPPPQCLESARWQLFGQASYTQLATPLTLLPRFASAP